MSQAKSQSSFMHRVMNDEQFLQSVKSSPEQAIEDFDIDDELETGVINQDEDAINNFFNGLKAATVFTVTVVYISRR